MLDQLQLILQALPWTGPAVLGGGVLALLSMMLFPRRRSRSDRVGFGLVIWCLTVALVVTLSPVRNNYFGIRASGCDWSVWRPLARQYWFSAGSRPPNVWLFLPAGVGVMLLDRVWRKVLGVIVLLALPPGIETLQDVYPELKRSCSSQDVVDNWTGLAIGLGIGLILALLIGLARWITRRSGKRRSARTEALVPEASAYPSSGMTNDGLPLGGGASHPDSYADFSDFDDTPSSTRWWEQRRDDQTRAAAPREESVDDEQATRAMPERARGSGPSGGHGSARPADDHTPVDGLGSGPQGRVWNDPDATQVIPRSRGGRGRDRGNDS